MSDKDLGENAKEFGKKAGKFVKEKPVTSACLFVLAPFDGGLTFAAVVAGAGYGTYIESQKPEEERRHNQVLNYFKK